MSLTREIARCGTTKRAHIGPEKFAVSASRRPLLHTRGSASAKAMQRFGEAARDLRGHKTIIRAERKYSRQKS
jgi:surfactin synthase thioesterase subunit